MKSPLLKLFVGVVCALVIIRAGSAEAEEICWVTKTSIMSEDLAGTGNILYDSSISVNEIILGYKDWYAGIWNATALSGHVYGESYGDEYDVYVGWAHTFDWVKVDLSSTYYAVASLRSVNDDLWVIEPEISLVKFPFVQPYIRGRYFGDVGSKGAKGGFFWFGGLRKSIPLCKAAAEKDCVLNLQASTAYAAGALHDSTGFVYGRLTVSLDVPLSKHWMVSPSLMYQVPTPEQRSDPKGFTKKNQMVVGITLGYGF